MSFLPPKDAEYLRSKNITFDEREDGGRKVVILKSLPMPAGKFDSPAADVLVLLPPGYPDAPPDMFYVMPWLKLTHNGAYPRAADHPFDFSGERWQRWSRHCDEWRPGEDGIWTMVKRVEHALQVAA